MDNPSKQLTFSVKPGAKIVLHPNISIYSNVYKQSAEGIAFITTQKIGFTDDKPAGQNYYYFFPWSQIKMFVVPIDKENPIDSPEDNPKG